MRTIPYTVIHTEIIFIRMAVGIILLLPSRDQYESIEKKKKKMRCMNHYEIGFALTH